MEECGFRRAHRDSARWGVDVMLPPNTTKSVVIKAAGTIDYYCKFHPNMNGQIAVEK